MLRGAAVVPPGARSILACPCVGRCAVVRASVQRVLKPVCPGLSSEYIDPFGWLFVL